MYKILRHQQLVNQCCFFQAQTLLYKTRRYITIVPWRPFQVLRLQADQTTNGINRSLRRTLSGYPQRGHRVTPTYFQAEKFLERTALIDQHGSHTYSDLLSVANNVSDKIPESHGTKVEGCSAARIAVLCPNDISYVVAQWATWMSGAIFVPLCASHPPSELKYFIEDSKSDLVITTEEMQGKLDTVVEDLGTELLVLRKKDYLASSLDSDVSDNDDLQLQQMEDQQLRRHNRLHQLLKDNQFKHLPAMLIYTSGTTGRPKGVLHTHGSLYAQTEGMIRAWGWTTNDVILHVLPLHHIHGIVNVLMTPLSCGATCVILPQFNAEKVWSYLLGPVTPHQPRCVNVFMAVPTIYAKLIQCYENRFNRGRGTKRAKDFIRATCSSKIRLMVSGSAALPEPIMNRWLEISGHTLLERYGMTEIGMALTNPLQGQRVAGAVGNPFPGVEVCVARPNVYAASGYDTLAEGHYRHTKVSPGEEGQAGELYVRGASMFKGYWERPEATAEAFTNDGWFKTGDTVSFSDGVYRILGRTSVDIIKSGGYKLSALEIERHLLSHDDITDIAVIGLPDMTWGQRVAAIIVCPKPENQLTLPVLKEWALQRLPSYKIPTALKVVDSLPRNAMGKVNKKELALIFFPKEMKNCG